MHALTEEHVGNFATRRDTKEKGDKCNRQFFILEKAMFKADSRRMGYGKHASTSQLTRINTGRTACPFCPHIRDGLLKGIRRFTFAVCFVLFAGCIVSGCGARMSRTEAEVLAETRAYLENGGDVDARDEIYGRTRLHHAAWDGYKFVAELLISHGADVNLRDKLMYTPLFGAANVGHTDVGKTLLENGADVNAADEYGGTALLDAACNGHADFVKLLLEYGANTNAKGWGDYTPLNLAAFCGHKRVVEILVDAGAEIDAEAIDGTPLHSAVIHNHLDIARLLLARGAKQSLPTACGVGDVTFVREHLKDEDISKSEGCYGWRLLHYAAACGQTEIIGILLDHKADIDVENDSEKTPLNLAALNGYKDAVKLLLSRGASVNATSDGPNPLTSAAYGCKPEIVELLIANGADIETGGSNEPLMLAAAKGYLDVVKVLVANGANVNATDYSGRTPLHWAVLQEFGAISESPRGPQDFLGVVKFLVKSGADVNAVDDNCKTPLDAFAYDSDGEMKRLLESLGAKRWMEIK